MPNVKTRQHFLNEISRVMQHLKALFRASVIILDFHKNTKPFILGWIVYVKITLGSFSDIHQPSVLLFVCFWRWYRPVIILQLQTLQIPIPTYSLTTTVPKTKKKNEDPYDGELDTIFLLHNDNILTDIQTATANYLYTAILTKINIDVLCKAKWENVFGDKIIWKNIWKTIHSGLIDNWDLNIIYQLIHQVIAVRKNI